MKKLLFLIGIAILGFAMSAEAQAPSPKTDIRQHSQQHRIRKGKRDGDLTRREAHQLKRQQRHIRRSERRMERDGNLTPREQRKLDRKQNRASKNIYRKKHNRRHRGAF